jgi:phage shock protein B
MDFFEFVIALIAIVGAFVTIWIIVVYQRKDKKQKPASETEYSLRELSAIAESMNQRIDTLESILDAEVPGWRQQHENQR